MPTLTVIAGDDAGRSVEFDREIVVGREGADLVLTNREVSRRHASLRPVDGGVRIEDLGSSSGTTVNGERITEAVTLTHDAAIEVGGTTLALALAEEQATRASAAPPGAPSQAPPQAAARVADRSRPRVLRMIWGPDSGRVLELDRELVLGRTEGDVTIRDPEVSRRHARVAPTEDGAEVEDLGSTNGTFVNGRRLDGPQRLRSGDHVQMGATEIVLELFAPGGTRVRRQVVDKRSRGAARMASESMAAIQAIQAEAVGAEIDESAGAEEALPAKEHPPPPKVTPLSPLARRLGVNDVNRRWWTLGAMCFGLAMAMLDTTAVVIALPDIQRELDAGIEGIEWTISAYTLAHAVLLVTGGRLGDIFGRRRLYLIGITIFASASALAGAAPSPGLLFAGRAIQGIGAAFMMPATLAIITNTFPQKERGRAIGIWAGLSALALAFGPALGGVLTSEVSWRAIFYINVPLAGCAIALTLLVAPESRDEKAVRRIDFPGIATLSLGLTALVLAVIESANRGWTSPEILALVAGGVILLAAFVVVERTVAAPIIRFEFLRSPYLVAAVGCALFVSLGLLSMLVYVAVFMQNVLGYDALETGLLFVPGTIMVAIVAPRAGALQKKIPSRYLMAGGLTMVAIALAIMTRITADTGYGVVLLALALVGIGVGIVTPAMSTTAVNAVRREHAGVASGMVSMCRQLGFALGVAIVGTVFESLSRSAAEESLAALRLPQEAEEGLTEAAAAGQLPAEAAAAGPGAVDAVQAAISEGIANAMYVPMGIAIAGAVLVLILTAGRLGTVSAAQPAAAAAGGKAGRHGGH